MSDKQGAARGYEYYRNPKAYALDQAVDIVKEYASSATPKGPNSLKDAVETLYQSILKLTEDAGSN
ncbi:MAG: hypothetical protein FVQ81_17180 [Candidatus Glassbacteria bacterium]|nr:hypothetical protein [Candidatus Glassbacteria bacterium]